ncbi:MAG: CHRD domain-containing protein [Candidatus Eisenbacteria bacterium]|nr:CHRD domain-containing protein [Candidatus Eisenbacteria bacterium]MCC7142954.1 CHRD domain-containing protein [Candidatus Eisenbacteria bacterium]
MHTPARWTLTAALVGSLAWTNAEAGRLFNGDCDGGQMEPPVESSASGHCDVYLSSDETKIWVEIRVESLENPMTASHLHFGKPGENGPQLFDLGIFADSTAQEFTIGEFARNALKRGEIYAAVHTVPYPVGELRGQMWPQVCASYGATLNGGQEVPPNGSGATGTADLTLWGDHSRLHAVLRTQNLTNPITGAHIHKAPPGVLGPQVFDFGTFGGMTVRSFVPTPGQVLDLDAGLYYVDIHTNLFPGGEIRGQLGENTPSGVEPLAAFDLPRLRVSPNPAVGEIHLSFELEAGAPIEFGIVDAAGRSVRALSAEVRTPGAWSATWDGRDDAGRLVPNGAYFARLSTSAGIASAALRILR